MRERVAEERGGPETDIDRVNGHERTRQGEDHPSREILDVDAAEVHGGASPRLEPADLRLVALEPANPRFQPAGLDLDLLAGFERAIYQRARNDGAEALNGEGAVDREAGPAEVSLRGAKSSYAWRKLYT